MNTHAYGAIRDIRDREKARWLIPQCLAIAARSRSSTHTHTHTLVWCCCLLKRIQSRRTPWHTHTHTQHIYELARSLAYTVILDIVCVRVWMVRRMPCRNQAVMSFKTAFPIHCMSHGAHVCVSVCVTHIVSAQYIFAAVRPCVYVWMGAWALLSAYVWWVRSVLAQPAQYYLIFNTSHRPRDCLGLGIPFLVVVVRHFFFLLSIFFCRFSRSRLISTISHEPSSIR